MPTRTISPQPLPARFQPVYQLGKISAVVLTAGGLIYFLVVLVAILTGQFNFPPPVWLQLFGGISSLLYCPFLVVMAACLHVVAPTEKKIYSLSSLGFTLLFAVSVSINRFSQLGVVRQAQAGGEANGIGWFLAYGDRSIMLGLEYLGWAWFLSLALLMAVPLFSGSRLKLWVRWLNVVYAVLGLAASVGFLLNNSLSLLGFAAWGVVLFVITALLAVFFHRGEKLV